MGAAGVDRQSIEAFEENLSNNLYKLWNRLSSGSYFPPPVRRVEIPKSDGGKRPLGIPTVADRIAQAVVKMQLEPYEGDSLEYLHSTAKAGSVNLIMTSPPFGLVRKKSYGNEDATEYCDWFRPFAEGIHRVLADDGSAVIDIGGA